MDRNFMPCLLEGPGDPMGLGAIRRVETDEEFLSQHVSWNLPQVLPGQWFDLCPNALIGDGMKQIVPLRT
jgi:hypothetical protein